MTLAELIHAFCYTPVVQMLLVSARWNRDIAVAFSAVLIHALPGVPPQPGHSSVVLLPQKPWLPPKTPL